MKKLGIGLIFIPIGILCGMLGAKVILSVSTLYGLTFISSLGFLKIYALMLTIYMLKYKKENKRKIEEEKETTTEIVMNEFIYVFDKVKIYLFYWGILFLVHYFLS